MTYFQIRRSDEPTIATNEFDDTIPSGDHEDGFDFYATYGPVFRANARFAEKLPVPDLGDADSSERSVEAFYAGCALRAGEILT